jgi:hypothetical protein
MIMASANSASPSPCELFISGLNRIMVKRLLSVLTDDK